MKFVAADGHSVLDRNHMRALASRMMRNILVDHTRARFSDKRRHQKVKITTRIDDD